VWINKAMSKLYKNWFVHNIFSHPTSEIVFWIVRPFIGRERAENVSGRIHDATLPDQPIGTGRG